jgi:hypothetical protein
MADADLCRVPAVHRDLRRDAAGDTIKVAAMPGVQVAVAERIAARR